MPSKNKFSVKTKMYIGHSARGRTVDGPWKGSPEAAIKAYANKIRKNGTSHEMVYVPTLVEKVPGSTEGGGGFCAESHYKTRKDLEGSLLDLLRAEGLKLGIDG
jgi:hypothetical protein